MDFSPCDMPLPALKMHYFSAGGDIIEGLIFRLVKWLEKLLHKKKKQLTTINVEAANSIVIFINTSKD